VGAGELVLGGACLHSWVLPAALAVGAVLLPCPAGVSWGEHRRAAEAGSSLHRPAGSSPGAALSDAAAASRPAWPRQATSASGAESAGALASLRLPCRCSALLA
jgi:hypothetical protein